MVNALVSAANAIIEAKTGKTNKGPVLIFTGAGVSFASGVPTLKSSEIFRGVEKAEKSNPDLFLDMMLEKPLAYLREIVLVKRRFLAAKPNMGHYAMAWLIKNGYAHTIITGNMDGLHEDTLGIDRRSSYNKSKGKFLDLGATLKLKQTLKIAMELASKAKIMIISGWSQDEHKLIKFARERRVKIIEIGPERKFAGGKVFVGGKDIFLKGFSQVVFAELQREIYMLDRKR